MWDRVGLDEAKHFPAHGCRYEMHDSLKYYTVFS